MTSTMKSFDKRVNRISRRHRKMAKGYVTRIQRNGLVSNRPRRSTGLRVSPVGVLMLIAGFFGFKGVLLAHLGTTTYNERIATLAEGTVIEQAGAWIMQIDPLMLFFARVFSPFIG